MADSEPIGIPNPTTQQTTDLITGKPIVSTSSNISENDLQITSEEGKNEKEQFQCLDILTGLPTGESVSMDPELVKKERDSFLNSNSDLKTPNGGVDLLAAFKRIEAEIRLSKAIAQSLGFSNIPKYGNINLSNMSNEDMQKYVYSGKWENDLKQTTQSEVRGVITTTPNNTSPKV